MSEQDFELRVATALRANVSGRAVAKARIMDRIRRDVRERELAGGRSVRSSFAGLLLAAGIGSIVAFSSFESEALGGSSSGVSSSVIGDTVVGRFRDTLRLVRLMFDDSLARQVSVAGEWSAIPAAMHRERGGNQWSVTLALRDGDHRYAIRVDNTRLEGVLHVARAN